MDGRAAIPVEMRAGKKYVPLSRGVGAKTFMPFVLEINQGEEAPQSAEDIDDRFSANRKFFPPRPPKDGVALVPLTCPKRCNDDPEDARSCDDRLQPSAPQPARPASGPPLETAPAAEPQAETSTPPLEAAEGPPAH